MSDLNTLFGVKPMLRHPLKAITGKGRSATYEDIDAGLMVRPVRLGARSVGFPADEVEAIMQARRAGATDLQIKDLVRRLHEARQAGAVILLSGAAPSHKKAAAVVQAAR